MSAAGGLSTSDRRNLSISRHCGGVLLGPLSGPVLGVGGALCAGGGVCAAAGGVSCLGGAGSEAAGGSLVVGAPSSSFFILQLSLSAFQRHFAFAKQSASFSPLHIFDASWSQAVRRKIEQSAAPKRVNIEKLPKGWIAVLRKTARYVHALYGRGEAYRA